MTDDTTTETTSVPTQAPETPVEAPETDTEPTTPDAALKALKAEREARRQAEARARELDAERAERERADTLARIAAEHGLTQTQAKFITGDTAEEMAANAAELAAAFAPSDLNRRPRSPLLTPMTAGEDPPPDYSSIAERIRERTL